MSVPQRERRELRRSSGPEDVPIGIPDFEPAIRTSEGRRLLCRLCRLPITSDAERTSVEGNHVHQRTNPFGLEFEIACFRGAPGAAAVGEATLEHTWFAGHTWEIAVCRGCSEHLGWRFQASASSFFGLIRNRLESEEVPDGASS